MKVRLKKMSGLKKRWMLSSVSITVVLVCIAVLLFSLSVGIYYYSSVLGELRAKAETGTGFFRNYISQDYQDFYQSCVQFAQSFGESDVLELQFISPNGKLIATSYGPWTGQIIQTHDVQQAVASRTVESFSGADPVTREHIMAVSSPMIYSNGEVIGVLRYVTSLRSVNRQVLSLSLGGVLIGAVFILIILLNSGYFIRSIITPVTEIGTVAKRIAAGAYGTQIQKKFDDEIGELADTINDMSVKIGQAEKTQAEFISSVSHELRTPLTAISGWGETLLSAENLDSEDARRGLMTILSESKRLTTMVEDLLEFTRIQDGRFTLNVQICDLRTEFEDAVFMYGNRLKKEGIVLEYLENDDDIPEVSCDPARLRQVFLNVLDNAAKHGAEGNRITAEMRLEGDEIVVRVRDFGPGIPEDEIPHVKLKFYKGSSKARGSGIGLAVCEEIISMHRGSLILENAEGGGTLVTIKIPVTEE